MKYLGNFHNNFSSAVGSQDKALQQDILLDKYAELIKQYPSQVVDALKQSDVNISSNPTTVQLIEKVAYNIHNNREFQHNISVLLTKYTEKNINPNFSYGNGERIPTRPAVTDTETIVNAGQYAGTYPNVENMFNTYNQSEGTKSGGGGDVAGVVTAVAGLTSSIFDYSAANKGLEASQEDAKARMFEKVFGKSQSKSWILPTVIIGGVLLIGGLVVFLTLRKKR
tara:strand:- start:1288 stop:1962 length:675 start_codon:yes stop_codon:yes gene_type:complete